MALVDKGYVRGNIREALEKLRKNQVENKFPLEKYEKLNPIMKVNEISIAVFEGAVLGFNEYFEASFEDIVKYLKPTPPSVLLFINSAYQITASGFLDSPKPKDLGLVLITAKWRRNIPYFGVKWAIKPSSKVNEIQGFSFTMWDSVSSSDKTVKTLFNNEIINEIYKKRKRMKLPKYEEAFPEPPEYVIKRLKDKNYAHEPLYSRCVELTNSWRIIVPNTSKDILSLPIPFISPTVCERIDAEMHVVIGDNFNVIVTSNGAFSIVLAVLFNLEPVREYLRYISPWSKGDTPRPRIKHVVATIDEFRELVRRLYSKYKFEAKSLATNLAITWYVMVKTLHSSMKPSSNSIKISDLLVKPLRENLSKLSSLAIEDNAIVVGNDERKVKLQFNDQYIALLSFLTLWNASGLKMNLNEALKKFHIPYEILQQERKYYEALKEVLYEKTFKKLMLKSKEEMFT